MKKNAELFAAAKKVKTENLKKETSINFKFEDGKTIDLVLTGMTEKPSTQPGSEGLTYDVAELENEAGEVLHVTETMLISVAKRKFEKGEIPCLLRITKNGITGKPGLEYSNLIIHSFEA